jgi:haloacid dehalogenase-like hydrolase
MIFRALACDYDGTLATHDRIGESTVGALQRARDAGLKLVLVTGRVFFELTRVCEHLDLFDIVVAENGGVLHFPGSGSIHSLAQPRPPALLSELERRAVAFRVGRVVVDTTRDNAEQALRALAAVGARMDLIFNRGFLMLVPPGVSKGFLFRSPDGRLIATADSLQAFRKALEVIPLQSVIFHAEREDFSRWIRDVFQDRVLARQVRKIETRWRHGDVHRLRDALAGPLAAAMAGLG